MPQGTKESVWIGQVAINSLRTLARDGSGPSYHVLCTPGRVLLRLGYVELGKSGIGCHITQAGRDWLKSIEGKPLQQRPAWVQYDW